ncbi:MAG: hypothetical protein GY696_25830, partial [Gammaproteobacteria bacterium]|nr:hypothetical protein [Gammaproteobacteria bacterium]
MGVFLEGPAYRVLRGCGVDATYGSVVAALEDTFLSPEESRIAAVKFLGRVQMGTETIFEYAHDLSDLIETAYPRVSLEPLDGLLRDRFLSGVLPRYQGWLRFQSCDTFQAAIACGRKVELLMQSERAKEVPDVQATVRQAATTEKNSVSVLSNEVHGHQALVDSGWRRRFFTLEGSPICLYCKRAGHVRRDCRQRLRDFGPPSDSIYSNDRCPPTPRHEMFTTVGRRERRPRGCRGAGRSRRPDFTCGGGASVRKRPHALDPIERPINAPVFEHTPTVDDLCAQMCNLDDPALFPGSKTAVIVGSAVEQPKGITLNQDCDVIPSDSMTMNVPRKSQKTMIQGVVDVPNLFSESGTCDDNLVSLDDDQKSISTVGNEYIECMAVDLARVRQRRPMLGGSPTFPTGMTVLSALLTTVLCFSLVSACFPVTEGQIFMPTG